AVGRPARGPGRGGARRSRRGGGRGVPPDGASRRWHGRRSARSGREAGAPLPATGSDDRATRARAHAVTEAVTVRPAAVVGLECALHLVPPRPRGLLRGRAGPAAGTGSILAITSTRSGRAPAPVPGPR